MIEIHRMHNKSKIDNKEIVPLISNSSVSEAVQEFKENPMIMAVKHACKLHKAILVSICKYGRCVAEGPISIIDIWRRLSDLSHTVSSTSDLDFTFPLPDFDDFLRAIYCLEDRGILNYVSKFDYLNEDDYTLATALCHNDIMSALKGHPFLKFA